MINIYLDFIIIALTSVSIILTFKFARQNTLSDVFRDMGDRRLGQNFISISLIDMYLLKRKTTVLLQIHESMGGGRIPGPPPAKGGLRDASEIIDQEDLRAIDQLSPIKSASLAKDGLRIRIQSINPDECKRTIEQAIDVLQR